MSHDDERFHDDIDRLVSASFDDVPRPELSRGFARRVAGGVAAGRRGGAWALLLEFVAAFATGLVLARAYPASSAGPAFAISVLVALVILPFLLIGISALSVRARP